MLFIESKTNTLLDHSAVCRKLELNDKRNRKQDCTERLDAAAAAFRYEDCQQDYWNPEEYSLLYGTPLWEQSSPSQRILLNHLYWVAYYSQIISAEIATIFFNQTSAAGLYGQEDFRLVCDMLDLESSQERAHISAFKRIAEQVEGKLFRDRVFTYPMRTPFAETMRFANTNNFKTYWKKLQLHAFGLLSADNTFLACQYFTVRGLRTLNGKIIQHQLSRYYKDHSARENAPIPAQISYYHFLDESFHFNSSTILSHEIINCLKPPTAFETWVANLGIRGCQKDHAHFSVAINGIFWYDPALYPAIYKILRSRIFDLEQQEALQMLSDCFTQESEGLHRSYKTHREAAESYQVYLQPLKYVWKSNQEMALMKRTSLGLYLKEQKRAIAKFTATCQ